MTSTTNGPGAVIRGPFVVATKIDDARLERVAKALSVADGNDPDFLVSSGWPPLLVRGRYYGFGDPVPLWHLYLDLARGVLDEIGSATSADAGRARGA